MRTAEILCAVSLLAVGVLVCYDSGRYGIFGWGAAGPLPGLYPFLLGAGTILGSVVVLAQAVRRARRNEPDRPFIPPAAWKPVLSVGIPATLMVFLTAYVGLFLAAGLYLAVYMRWIGRHRWITVAAVSILLPLAGYIVFVRWFLIPLPEGTLLPHLGL
jgi:hypothetical protein